MGPKAKKKTVAKKPAAAKKVLDVRSQQRQMNAGNRRARTLEAEMGGNKTAQKRKRSSKLMTLVREGKVVRAFKPFAIFMAENKGMSLCAGAARWKTLSKEEQDSFKQRSAREFEQQRQEALGFGVRVRLRAPRQRAGHVATACPGSLLPRCMPRDEIATACPGQMTPPRVPKAKPTAAPLVLGAYHAVVRDKLGQGSYGSVILVEGKDGRRHAAKVYAENNECRRETRVYDKIWKAGGHPAFVQLTEVMLGKPWSWIVMPWVADGSLSSRMRRPEPMPDPLVAIIIQQLRDGLHHMHSKAHMLHLDMKPANLLWNECCQHLVIIDFSLVEPWPCPAGHPLAESYVSCPYRPPELFFAGTLSPILLRPAVDAWGVGCVLYELLTKTRLINPTSQDTRGYATKMRDFVDRVWKDVSWPVVIPRPFYHVVRSLLNPRAMCREILGHPFAFHHT